MQRFLFLFHPRGVRLARAVSQGSRAGARFFVTQHAFVVYSQNKNHTLAQHGAYFCLAILNSGFAIPGRARTPKSIRDGWNQARLARGELGFS